MNGEKIIRAMGDIDDALIEGALNVPAAARRERTVVKWAAAAAVLVIAAGALTLPGMLRSKAPDVVPAVTTADNGASGEGCPPGYNGIETVLYARYDYKVDSGEFASYVKGRVIHESLVAEKIADVTVTAGWIRPEGYPQAEKEHAAAEIFTIKGVPKETAVAIRFIDKLEAQLTGFYYVIMNPEADLSPVSVYVIRQEDPAFNDGGMPE